MRLSDKDLHKYIENGELVIIGVHPKFPFDRYKQVQPCSVDVRLGNRFYKFKDEVKQFDIKDLINVSAYYDMLNFNIGDKIIINPQEVLLGQVYEQIRIPTDLSGMLEGKSRFARLGLSIHANGGFGNPGFEGAWPLQIRNNNRIPIIIYPYMFVAQIIFVKLTSKPLISYQMRSDTKYQGEVYAGLSVSHIDPAISGEIMIPALNAEIEKRLINKYIKDMENDKLVEKLSSNNNKSKGDTIIIQNSQFGNLNTGEIIGNVNANINVLENDKTTSEIAGALKKLTEFILDDKNKLDDKEQNEAVKLVEELSNQAKAKKEERSNKSILKAITNEIGSKIKSIVKDTSFWKALYTTISGFFGF